jgi:hypothetical protein
MNRPKTPPRAKPAPPERTVLAGQDSMPICICGEGVSRWYDGGERGGGTALMICCWRRSSGDMFSLLPRPPSGLKPPKLMVGAGLGWSREAGVRSGGVVGRQEARRLKISLEVEFGIVPRNGVFRVAHGPTAAPQKTLQNPAGICSGTRRVRTTNWSSVFSQFCDCTGLFYIVQY